MIWKDPIFFVFIFFLMGSAVWLLIDRKPRRPSLQFSHIAIFKDISPSLRSQLSPLVTILKFVSLILMVFALARPQTSEVKVKKNVEGIDIIITLDISDSMLIEDMKPVNRLEAAKEVAYNFVKGRTSDRIGLVLFSGEAFTKVPPTLDYKVFLQSLKSVEVTRNVKMGTAIGVALGNSVARLRELETENQVIIFLTDGENNSGTIDPLTALEIAKGYGIRVYTIGVGVDGMAQLPTFYTDIFGNKRKRYQPMHSKVNDELLSKIARDTGGKYYRATNTKTLENVFSEIDRIEKTKIETHQYTKYTELFPDYLKWAIFFYLLAFGFERIFLRRGP